MSSTAEQDAPRAAIGFGQSPHAVAAPAAPRRLSDDQFRERRQVRARLDAAQTTDENTRHWAQADSLSPDAAYSPSIRRLIRNRARYEAVNNTYCAGMIKTLANDVIGTGPTLQMQTGNRELDRLVESAFWSWQQATRFADKLRTMKRAKCRDGESFAVFFSNVPLRQPVKLDLRLYEAEQIANPLLVAISSAAALTDGVMFDDFGNVAGYTVLKHHPGSTIFTGMPFDSETIPAARMVHWFDQDRPGQSRGIPEILPALPLYAQLRRFTLAVIAAAETAADLAILLKTQVPPEMPDNIQTLDVFDLEKRSAMTLPKGWDPFQMKAEQPTTTYEMFKRAILSEIARCLSMPYNVAAGDSSSYNYSSGRLDHKTYYKSIRVERVACETTVCDPTFALWWQEARLIEGFLPESARGLYRLVPPAHAWRWDGDEHVDPLKEANATNARLESLTDTLASVYGRENRDWEEELRQIAKERALMRELGIERTPKPAPKPAAPTARKDADDPEADETAEPDEDQDA